MKSRKNSISNLIIMCALCLVIASCNEETKDVKADIQKANEEFMNTFGKGDASALAKLYTADAKLYPANSDVIEGQKSIEGFWNGVMQMGVKKASLETVKAQSHGDIAIEEGRYALYADGDKVIDKGKYIVTWAKEGTQWKLQNDMWTTNQPSPQQRAAANDTIWIIANHILPNKVQQFEEFNYKILEPATAEAYPVMRNTVRTLKSVQQNADKTYTYYYLMDPATSPDGYDMMKPLQAKYGEAKAKEYVKMFEDCLKGGKQESHVAVQTDW